MSKQRNITIATANAHTGRLVRHPRGFEPFEEADAILLQEVSPRRDDLLVNLRRFGFSNICLAERFDLAIAARSNIKLDNRRTDNLRSRLGVLVTNRLAGYETIPPYFRQPGILAARLETTDGDCVTAATMHPFVPLKPISRNRQVRAAGEKLAHPYYQGPLVLGGDMNHWPSPRTIDKEMRADANLHAVNLGEEPTWRPETNEHPPLVALGKIAMKFGIDISGQLDAMYYRGGLVVEEAKVIDIESDHRGIMARFRFLNQLA